MTRNRRNILGRLVLAALVGAATTWTVSRAADPAPTEPLKLLEPKPLVPRAKVVTLWPAGSPMLRPLVGWDKPEVFNRSKGRTDRVESVVNIHNPSIEVHLAPPDKANGMAIIVAAGGGNMTCNVGPEGTAIADWLNGLGIHAFIERYRLRPYGSGTDALADTQRRSASCGRTPSSGASIPGVSASWASPRAASRQHGRCSSSTPARRMQWTPSIGSVAGPTSRFWCTPAGAWT